MQEALDLALARLWEEGCPLADPTSRAHMISNWSATVAQFRAPQQAQTSDARRPY
jgi:hypothetical protein